MKKLLILLIALILVLFIVKDYKSGSSKSVETPVPSASPSIQRNETRSLEGDKKLIMTTKQNADGKIQYTFLIPNSGNELVIFTKVADRGETINLPQNSWSPSSKYVFLEDRRGSMVDYLVFKTNGEPFADGQKYLNATALFNAKVKDYNLKAITGWDDPVLMHVLTFNGPPFWFDLTTQSFIQLVR